MWKNFKIWGWRKTDFSNFLQFSSSGWAFLSEQRALLVIFLVQNMDWIRKQRFFCKLKKFILICPGVYILWCAEYLLMWYKIRRTRFLISEITPSSSRKECIFLAEKLLNYKNIYDDTCNFLDITFIIWYSFTFIYLLFLIIIKKNEHLFPYTCNYCYKRQYSSDNINS